ncbi:MAG: hypothetical protein AMXMBFR55_24460 [Gemmatimonadota bacterium]
MGGRAKVPAVGATVSRAAIPRMFSVVATVRILAAGVKPARVHNRQCLGPPFAMQRCADLERWFLISDPLTRHTVGTQQATLPERDPDVLPITEDGCPISPRKGYFP